ncbi:alanine racemase [Kistimonas scapharcae]|uniref:Alanine racemase n=1 Tax=Kistimonas scapharcae TaxID=1036133 RepID=A0ABP8V6Z4_9GAMM
MSRPAQATINLQALRDNLAFVRQLSSSKVVGVIKANAYGHGALTIARVLESERIDCLAVACIEEALELRHNGIQSPILLLEGFYSADELPLIEQYQLTTVIQHQDQIGMLLAYPTKEPLSIWLKLDSGMHRIGFLPKDYPKAYQALIQSGKVKDTVFMTHFSCADDLNNDYTRRQLSTFRRITAGLEGETSLCNSPGVLGWPEAHGNWVRPGLMLYGASPFDVNHPHARQLKPVMELSSSIIAIRDLPAGVPVGYSGTFITNRTTRAGVVAIGYADGYPRHTPSGAPVVINGKRARIMGKISMDMMTVDLTDLPDVKTGDKVILWGAELPAAEVAQHAGTIPYELFCNMKRVNIRYIDAPVTTKQSDTAESISH